MMTPTADDFKNPRAVKVSRLPVCDIHKYELDDADPPLAAVDGRTKNGPWANMCEPCFEDLGVGLGLGRGQMLVLDTSS